MLFGDGHACHIDGICTVHIKMLNETMRELQDVGCVPHLNKNLISVESLEEGLLRVFKMFSGSLVVLKGIQHNNLYYMKNSVVTENLTASECLDGDSIRLL